MSLVSLVRNCWNRIRKALFPLAAGGESPAWNAEGLLSWAAQDPLLATTPGVIACVGGSMPYTLLADLLVVVHFVFVAFIILGGLAAGRWAWVVWLHLPAVCWGVGIEWTGGICPLTPLETWLRIQAGEAAYETDFVAQYLLPLLYPVGLTRATQFTLGSAVLLVNGLIYGLLWRQRSRDRRVA